MGALAFNADEVFTIAEQIERNGAKFYRAAAQKFPAGRELFTKLAEMEDVHLKVFSEMHKTISEREKELTASDPDGEALQLAGIFANNKVFDTAKDPLEALKSCKDVNDVFQFAIGREKDSVVFYTGLKDMVSKSFGKDKLDLIIKEEMSHIVWLSREMDKKR
jgi:rubrerythrin